MAAQRAVGGSLDVLGLLFQLVELGAQALGIGLCGLDALLGAFDVAGARTKERVDGVGVVATAAGHREWGLACAVGRIKNGQSGLLGHRKTYPSTVCSNV